MTEHTARAGTSPSAEESGPIVHEFTATDPIDATIQNLRGDIVVRAEHGTAVRFELTPHGADGRELAQEMRIRFEAGRLFVDTASEAAQAFGGSVGDLLRGLGGESGGTSWTDRLTAGLRSARRGIQGVTGSLDITVLVPQGSRVVLHDGAGDVRVHGAHARDRGEVRQGRSAGAAGGAAGGLGAAGPLTGLRPLPYRGGSDREGALMMTTDIEDHVHGPDEAIAVRDNPRAERYEAVRAGEVVGIVIYKRTRRRFELIHTVTDPAHRGEGVASVLARTVLAEARAATLPVLVICPFIESWLQRHPEQASGVIIDD